MGAASHAEKPVAGLPAAPVKEAPEGRRALFLDRDGTLIRDVGYPRFPCQVELIHGAATAVATIAAAGFLPVLVSNQSGVGRAVVSEAQLRSVHESMAAKLGAHGVSLAAAYYCPHAPWDGCSCRKPMPGLLLKAANELGIDLACSIMVGDKPTDVEAGRAAGCHAVLLSHGGAVRGACASPDLIAESWMEVVEWVLRQPWNRK